MTTPRSTGRRAGGRNPRSAAAVALAALTLVSLGCDKDSEIEQAVKPEAVAGAELKASATSVRTSAASPARVTLDASGSKLGDGTACPKVARYYSDNTPGADSTISSANTTGNAPCVLRDAAVTVPMLAAATPGTRQQAVAVDVEGTSKDGKKAFTSTKTLQIGVETTGAAPSAPSAPATTPSTGTGTTTPHTPPTKVGQDPVPSFVVNPNPPIAGRPVHLDARVSQDTDGTIVSYRWDFNDDGAIDSTTTNGLAQFTAGPQGTVHRVSLEVVDNDGNSAKHTRIMNGPETVHPATHLEAGPTTQSPANPTAGFGSVSFTGSTIARVDEVHFDGPDADEDADDNTDPDGQNPQFFTSFPNPGTYTVALHYVDNDSGEASVWTTVVKVGAPAGRVAASAAAVKKKRFKGLTTTATMRLSSDLVDIGRLSFVNGELSTTNAIIRGRISGKLPRKAARRVPRQLRGLYRSDYVGRFSGRRISLSPTAFTLAGTGTILARPRKGKRTLVCLSVKTNGGVTPNGSTWRLIGAKGKVRGFKATGTFAPPIVGMQLPSTDPTRLTVSKGRVAPLSPSCRALAKRLAKKKR